MLNIRISIRLGAAFVFLLAMLLVTALTGLIRIESLGDTAETLAGSRYQKAEAAASLREQAALLLQSVSVFRLRDSETERGR